MITKVSNCIFEKLARNEALEYKDCKGYECKVKAVLEEDGVIVSLGTAACLNMGSKDGFLTFHASETKGIPAEAFALPVLQHQG